MKRFIRWLVSRKHGVALGIFAVTAVFLRPATPATIHFSEAEIEELANTLMPQATFAPIPLPTPNPGQPNPPAIAAQGALVIAYPEKTVLFEQNADVRLLPASTTKIMTALIALEEYDLEEPVTITTDVGTQGHRAELVSGEVLSVRNLLYALMVSSGNDAALALAQHHENGYQHYVDAMNRKAKELDLKNTNFQNVSGLESYDHYTSARDLAVITMEALKDPFFREIVSTKKITITSLDGRYSHPLENLNRLLWNVEGVRGVKTGWTDNSGECLVTYTNRKNKEIITVILGSPDRFGESTRLIEWAYSTE